MSPSRSTTIEQLRAELWPQAAPATRANVEELAGLLERLRTNRGDDELRAAAIACAHAVAGSAGVYGFADAARAAQQVETTLRTRELRDDAIDACLANVEVMRVELQVSR
ncbi:MAG: Hpt domain-containing protein [Thermoleophilia bacterium]|nr:Hpt domain-containing protein [Thermoleophilia bacterium]